MHEPHDTTVKVNDPGGIGYHGQHVCWQSQDTKPKVLVFDEGTPFEDGDGDLTEIHVPSPPAGVSTLVKKNAQGPTPPGYRYYGYYWDDDNNNDDNTRTEPKGGNSKIQIQ
jgi:hypothetical protein